VQLLIYLSTYIHSRILLKDSLPLSDEQCRQGDLVILLKNRPKTHIAQPIFAIINKQRWKKQPKIWVISIITKTLPKVNSHPIGEHSPNLVTLNDT
jgi:hypothetical protein